MRKKLLALVLSLVLAASLLAACQTKPAETEAPATTQENKETDAPETDAPETDAPETDAPETDAPETDAPETDAPTGGAGEIKVWVADNVVDFTKKAIEDFKAANPDYADWNYTVEAVGEGDAATNMITDVTAGADIYSFAQDQLSRLVIAGALEVMAPENEEAVKTENDAASVGAATLGDTLYAYPMTSDNGYFLYYDKSVVTDPSSLEKIVSDCEAAGKNFYFEINSGWYQTAFFFGAGAELTYDCDDSGNLVSCNSTYASDAGLVALKEMIELKASPAFQNGSSLSSATDVGAIVDGTWDSGAAKDLFGDNYACAKLPEFEGADGKTYQLGGFGGFKLLGVKPQEDEEKLAVCDALAAYLTSGDVQLARYKEVGWGPSNIAAQNSEEVKSDEALSALAEQLQFTIPQGQYPGDYWSLATSLGDSIISGELTTASSDEDLQKALQNFEDTCKSYVNQ